MTEEEWLRCADLDAMFLALPGSLRWRDRKLRLFACGCCRMIPEFMESEPDRESVELAELEVDGLGGGREYPDEIWDIRWYHRDAGESVARAISTFRAEMWNANDLNQADEAKRYEVLSHGGRQLASLLRDIFGNPFRPVSFSPAWRTSTALTLARQMYESRDFSLMPILADALQDAGCENEDILAHCRDANQPHVRGCWVVDLVLGKE